MGKIRIFCINACLLRKNRFLEQKSLQLFQKIHKNLASHLGQILLFDSSTGRPVAMMDANAITWLRTAAVSALATDYLAAQRQKYRFDWCRSTSFISSRSATKRSGD